MELRFCGYTIRFVFWIQRVQSWSLDPRLLSEGITQHLKNWLDLLHDSGQNKILFAKIGTMVLDLWLG